MKCISKINEANDIVLTSPNRDKPSDQHQRTNTKVQSGTRANTNLNADVLFSDCQAKNTKRCHPKLYKPLVPKKSVTDTAEHAENSVIGD